MSNNLGSIVVAEDDSDLLYALSEILKDRGYSVRTSLDGFRALAEIRARQPDILLSDLNMPDMSGFELLSVVRRRYPKIKVVAMSGAYSGEAMPPGVAADAFYEKGGASVVRLLEMVDALRAEPNVRSPHAVAPIWVPKLAAAVTDLSRLLFACPECLRAYPHQVSDTESIQETNCPYCLYQIHLAIVPSEWGICRTTLSTACSL